MNIFAFLIHLLLAFPAFFYVLPVDIVVPFGQHGIVFALAVTATTVSFFTFYFNELVTVRRHL